MCKYLPVTNKDEGVLVGDLECWYNTVFRDIFVKQELEIK